MQVLCIDAADRPGEVLGGWEVVSGHTYTVLDFIPASEITEGRKEDSYSLVESPEDDSCWACDRFIPLSTIDETVMERYYETEKIGI